MASYEIAVKLNTDSALDGLRKITDSITLIEVKANTVFTNIGNLMSKTFNAGLRVGNSMFNGLVSGIQKLGSFFRSILGEAINLFKKMETAALAAVVAISYGTGKAVTAAASRQREFSMLDRVGTSQAERSQLRSIGLQPGGSISGSYQSYARLRDMGMDSGLSMGLVGGMTRLAGRTGASPDETNRAITALMQMKSKGKVTGEELRGQLMEALPAASGIIKSQFGTTNIDELTKIPIDTFIQKFVKGLNDLAPATFTAFDAIKNLKQGIQELIISFGEGFMGGDFTQKLGSFNDILEALQPTAKAAGEGLRVVVDWLVQLGQKILDNKEAIAEWVSKGWEKLVGWIEKAAKFMVSTGFISAIKNIGKAIGEMIDRMSSKDNLDAMVRGFELIAVSVQKIAEAMLKIPFDTLMKTINSLLDAFNKIPDGLMQFFMTQGMISHLPGGKSAVGRSAYTGGMYGFSPIKSGIIGGAIGFGAGGGGGLLRDIVIGLLGAKLGGIKNGKDLYDSIAGKGGVKLPYDVSYGTPKNGGPFSNVPKSPVWDGTNQYPEWARARSSLPQIAGPKAEMGSTVEEGSKALEVVGSASKLTKVLKFLGGIAKILAVVSTVGELRESYRGNQSWGRGIGKSAATASMFIPGPVGMISTAAQAGWGVGKFIDRNLGISDYLGDKLGSAMSPITPEQAAEAAGPSRLRGLKYKGFYDMYNPAREKYKQKQDAARRARLQAEANWFSFLRSNKASNDTFLSSNPGGQYDKIKGMADPIAKQLGYNASPAQLASSYIMGITGGSVPGWNTNYTPLGFPEFNPGKMASGAMDAAKQVGSVSMTHTIDLSPQTQEFVASVTSPAAASSLNTHMNQWITDVATTQRI